MKKLALSVMLVGLSCSALAQQAAAPVQVGIEAKGLRTQHESLTQAAIVGFASGIMVIKDIGEGAAKNVMDLKLKEKQHTTTHHLQENSLPLNSAMANALVKGSFVTKQTSMQNCCAHADEGAEKTPFDQNGRPDRETYWNKVSTREQAAEQVAALAKPKGKCNKHQLAAKVGQ